MEARNESSLLPVPPPVEFAERVVLFIDMVSYSRHIGLDEAATLEFMAGCFDSFRILSRRFNGTLVKTLGDGALLLFDGAVDAISFGVEFQNIVADRQTGTPDPFMFRVGLHLGDVQLRNGDVFGNTVNIAARLQEKARPGDCVLSRAVFDAIREETDYGFEPLGAQTLRNIRDQVAMYRVVDLGSAHANADPPQVHRIEVLGRPDGFLGPDSRLLGADARALLGYLVLCSGRADAFDRLEALIGSARRVSQALEELSGTTALPLHRLDQMVALDIRATESDLEAFLAELRHDRIPLRLATDPNWPEHILAGLDEVSPMFRGWVRIMRSMWRRRLLGQLERVIGRTDPSDEAHEAAADAILLLEPGNEIASYARISARHALGDQSAALDEFRRLDSYLKETHAVSPGARILDLIRSIRARVAPAAAASGDRPRRRRLLRIAVAEFNEPPDAPEQAHGRVAAFRADLLENLTPFRDWSIIDGEQVALAAEGERDQIDYLFQGDVLTRDGDPMLSLRLSKASSGRRVWADSVSLLSADWSRSQIDIVRNIAATLESHISADRLALVVDGSRKDLTSHDAWLRGDRALMRWTPEGAEEARKIFEEILRDDPDHAPSLFRLASITNIEHIIRPGRQCSAAEYARADSFARKAADLDPMDARVQRTVAWSAAMTGAFARASMHMDLAMNLHPISPATLASCAMGFAWLGERTKAETTLTRCLAVSRMLPPWGWAYNAATYFFLDRLDAALEAAELGGTSILDSHGWVAAIHARLGNEAKAGAAFARLVETVTPAWAGPEPATPAAIAEWFGSAFPLREDRDRQVLVGAIRAAHAHAGY